MKEMDTQMTDFKADEIVTFEVDEQTTEVFSLF